jgi:hypothetical protein
LHVSFHRILSDELLSKQLFEFCKWRFKNKDNINLIHGDSSQILPEILKSINQQAIFWLDGHYSGGNTAIGKCICPLLAELNAIEKFGRKDNIILIDDARLLGNQMGFPSLEEVQNLLYSINPSYNISIIDDMVNATF